MENRSESVIDCIVDLIEEQCLPGMLGLVDPITIAETILRRVPCWRDAGEQDTQNFVNLVIAKLHVRCGVDRLASGPAN